MSGTWVEDDKRDRAKYHPASGNFDLASHQMSRALLSLTKSKRLLSCTLKRMTIIVRLETGQHDESSHASVTCGTDRSSRENRKYFCRQDFLPKAPLFQM